MQEGTYTFDQLSDKLKEEAIDRNRDINVFGDWHEFVIDRFKEDLAEEGVDTDDVQFTGFYSQGDGASFTGHVSNVQIFLVKALGLTQFSDEEMDDLPAGIKEKVQEFIDTLSINFSRKSSRYSHENTCETETRSEIVYSGDYYDDEYPDSKILLINKVGVDPLVFMDLAEEEQAINEAAEEWRLDKCRELYRDLEEEHDGLQSDESVADTLEANGMEFEVDEDGELI